MVAVIKKAFGEDAVSCKWCWWFLEGPRIQADQDSDRSFSDTLEQRPKINTPKFLHFRGVNQEDDSKKEDLDVTPPLHTDDGLPEHKPMDAYVYQLEDPEPMRNDTSMRMFTSGLEDSKIMFRQNMSMNYGSRVNNDQNESRMFDTLETPNQRDLYSLEDEDVADGSKKTLSKSKNLGGRL